MNNKNSKISENYDEHALEYDRLSREAAPWLFFDRPFLSRKVIPSFKRNSKILDFGCGAGKAIDLFLKKGFSPQNIYGIDISRKLINIAQGNIPKAEFHVGDFTKFMLPKNRFDAAISVRSVEYLNEKELEKAFMNVFRSLKKDGKFFVITGHPLRVNNGHISTYLQRGPRKVSLPWGMKVDLYHKTIGDFVNIAVRAGFFIESIEEPNIPESLKKLDRKRHDYYKSFGAINLHFVLRK